MKANGFITLSIVSNGEDGASVTGVYRLYAVSDSPTSAPTSGWNTTIPTYDEHKYIWSITVTQFSKGEPVQTDPVCITGVKGADGRSISYITTEYAVSSSGIIPPASVLTDNYGNILTDQSITLGSDGGWTEDISLLLESEWDEGKYIWERTKIVFENPDGVLYTEPRINTMWDKTVNNTTAIRSIRVQVDQVEKVLFSKATLDEIVNGEWGTRINTKISNMEQTVDGFETSVQRFTTSVENLAQKDAGGTAYKVNYESFTAAKNNCIYVCGYDNSHAVADVNGWVTWNGLRVSVLKEKVYANPGTEANPICPQTTIYLVQRAGVKYLVWYEDKRNERGEYVGLGSYKSTTAIASTVSDWSWQQATDIVLCSFLNSSDGIKALTVLNTSSDNILTSLETQSRINQKADGILLEVSGSYASKTEMTNAVGRINVLAGEVDLEAVDASGQKTSKIAAAIDAAETRVTNRLTGDYSTLRAEADNISSQVSNFRGELTTVKQTADAVALEVTNARGDKTSLNTRIEGIQTEVSNTKGEVTTLTQTVSGLKTAVKNELAGEFLSIDATSSQVDTLLSNSTGYSQLKQTVDNLSSEVLDETTGLKTRVDQTDKDWKVCVSRVGLYEDEEIHPDTQFTVSETGAIVNSNGHEIRLTANDRAYEAGVYGYYNGELGFQLNRDEVSSKKVIVGDSIGFPGIKYKSVRYDIGNGTIVNGIVHVRNNIETMGAVTAVYLKGSSAAEDKIVFYCSIPEFNEQNYAVTTASITGGTGNATGNMTPTASALGDHGWDSFFNMYTFTLNTSALTSKRYQAAFSFNPKELSLTPSPYKKINAYIHIGTNKVFTTTELGNLRNNQRFSLSRKIVFNGADEYHQFFIE